eukprot:UN30086
MTIILYDRNTKARCAALNCLSSMLEHSPLSQLITTTKSNKKSNTKIDHPISSRGYSQAERMSKIVVALHVGLICACTKETKDVTVAIHIVKTLASLVQNMDYDKLDPGLLCNMTNMVLEKLPTATGNLHCAYLYLLYHIFDQPHKEELLVFLLPPYDVNLNQDHFQPSTSSHQIPFVRNIINNNEQ